MTSPRAAIVQARRSVFGKYRGGLSGIRPDDLLAGVLGELAAATPSLDLANIDDVIMGDANQAGEDNRNVARMASLLAGWPTTVPGVTLNRLCGSGAEAIVQAARAIRAGDADIVVAGGVESMSRAPYVLPKSDQPLDPKVKLEQTTVGWRMTNPQFPKHWTDSLGECAQRSAEELGIGRQEQDEWALRSHELASAAWAAGKHDGFAVPMNGIERDESIRPDTTLEKLAALKPAFTADGSVTAGNSSPLNDGAVATLLMSESAAKDHGLEPLAFITASAVSALEPDRFANAPVPAVRALLKRTGLTAADIDLFEINEAFAAMVLTVLREAPEIPVAKVNPNGGAIAIGHPVGASAARVVIDTARELQRRGGGRGIATACIGVGLGIAVLVEVP
ncbi:MAG: acetyl-CoA acyltransferase [Actinomycetota bacterium]